jgi:hypothetical protein
VVRARTVIISGTGAGVGVFVYNGTPALGNAPIVSITSASADPYGNAVVPGLDVTQGTISGTTISGPDYVINSAGLFVYEGTPAAGNLIASLAATAGTDSHGNGYTGGVGAYTAFGSGDEYSIQLLSSTAGEGAFVVFDCINDPFDAPPFIAAVGDNSSGAAMALTSGAGSGADGCGITLQDSVRNGGGESGVLIQSGEQEGYPVLNPGTTQTLDGANFPLLQDIGQLGFLAQLASSPTNAQLATKVNNLLTELINQNYMFPS